MQHKSKTIKGVTDGVANALQSRRIERLKDVLLIPSIVQSNTSGSAERVAVLCLLTGPERVAAWLLQPPLRRPAPGYGRAARAVASVTDRVRVGLRVRNRMIWNLESSLRLMPRMRLHTSSTHG